MGRKQTALSAALSLLILTMAAAGCKSASIEQDGSKKKYKSNANTNVSFSGSWDSNWGPVTIEQNGSQITGVYGGRFPGRIEGTAAGNRADVRWYGNNGEFGRAYFILSSDKESLSGRWGSIEDNSSSGEWNAVRNK